MSVSSLVKTGEDFFHRLGKIETDAAAAVFIGTGIDADDIFGGAVCKDGLYFFQIVFSDGDDRIIILFREVLRIEEDIGESELFFFEPFLAAQPNLHIVGIFHFLSRSIPGDDGHIRLIFINFIVTSICRS